MKKIWLFSILALFAAGCSPASETMVLLDEPVKSVKLSAFENFGGINEDYKLSFNQPHEVEIFKQAVKSAVKQSSADMNEDPDYDMLVEYLSEEGDLPSHGIHMWTEDAVKFMYIGDEDIYAAAPAMSEKLKAIIK